MRIYSLTLILLILLCIDSCSGDRSNFEVEVTVNGSKGEVMYLARRTISGSFVVDSGVAEKSGNYVLRGYTNQPDFYILYIKPGNYINLIIHPGDDFRVLTEAATFDRNYLVEGSADSRLIQKMVNMQIRTMEQITLISERYESSRNSANFVAIKAEIDSAYEKIFNEHKSFSIALIKENPQSLATLMTLYQQLGRNTPVFNYKNDFMYYEMVDSNLSPLYPNSEAVIDLNRKVAELKKVLQLEPGSPAPELSLPDTAGKIVSLSSLKGKPLIMLFWASWSSQSITELDRLESLHSQLRGGVEYYQVSLDRTRESWLKNITGTGIHVSDLKYWDSPVVQAYQIEKLPVTFLLDENGTIVARDFEIDDVLQLINK